MDRTSSPLRRPRASRTLIVCSVLVASIFAAAPASAAPAAPEITSPVAGAHLSIGLDDADPSSARFQHTVSGTAEPSKVIEVFAQRPGGEPTELGETTSGPTGQWTLSVTQDPGEWVLFATAKDDAESADRSEPSADTPIFIVLRYVFTWYDLADSAGNWVLVANPGSTAARADVSIDGVKRGDTLTLAPGTAGFPTFPGVVGGPVVVDSLDGVPLVVTQRNTWTSGDLEEVPGVFDGSLTSEAWISWYDTLNTDNRDWILVTNFGKLPTTAEVRVAGSPMKAQVIDPGESGIFREPGIENGPVRVTADQPILASRRTLWTPSNFTEITGTPSRWLDTSYAFTWFDSVNTQNADWLLVANPNDSEVTVWITPPDREPVAVEIAAGKTHLQQFPELMDGPVFVDSDLPVHATQRALWSDFSSFEEVAGVAWSEITDTYWQSWYDEPNSAGDWMLQASTLGASDEGADVAYTIEGPTIDASGTLEPGEVEIPQFPGKMEGPLVVSGDGPFIHSKRTLWGSPADFMEITGLRGTTRSGLAASAAAPDSFSASDVADDDGSRLRLTWNKVDDPTVDGYWVYRGSPEVRIAWVAQEDCAATCEYVDEGLTPGVEYSYAVRGLSLATVEGVPAVAAGTPQDNPPTAPTGLQATPGDEEVALNWDDPPSIEDDIIGWHVYVAELGSTHTNCTDPAPLSPGDADYTKVTTTGLATERPYTVGNLNNGTRYCFKITAVDAAQHESPRSDPAQAEPGAVPPQVTVTEPNGGEIFRGDGANLVDVTWTDSDPDGNQDRVQIEYATDADAESPNWIMIEQAAANDGQYTWDPPAADSQSVRIRVNATDTKENTHSDVSDANFAIDSSAPTGISVVDPAPGEVIRGGTSTRVEWNFTEANPDSVKTEYTINDGTSWIGFACEVTFVDADTAGCDWSTPEITSPNVKIRVTMTDAVAHVGSGTSAAFTMDSTAPDAPAIDSMDGQEDSPATGSDPTPRIVVVHGESATFTEGGTVKVYVGAQPSSCSAEPNAAKQVAQGQSEVVFNDADDSDVEMPDEGNNTLWTCMVDLAGNMSGISASFAYVLDTTPPAAPTGLQGEPGGTAEVLLSWTAASGGPLKGYIVWRTEDPIQDLPSVCSDELLVPDEDFQAVDVDPDTGVTTAETQYLDSGLTTGTRYCYAVSAVDSVGNEGERSERISATAG